MNLFSDSVNLNPGRIAQVGRPNHGWPFGSIGAYAFKDAIATAGAAQWAL